MGAKNQANIFERLAVGFGILAKYRTNVVPKSTEGDIHVEIGTPRNPLKISDKHMEILLSNGFRLNSHSNICFRLPQMDEPSEGVQNMADALKRAHQRLDEQDLTVFSLRSTNKSLGKEVARLRKELNTAEWRLRRMKSIANAGQAVA